MLRNSLPINLKEFFDRKAYSLYPSDDLALGVLIYFKKGKGGNGLFSQTCIPVRNNVLGGCLVSRWLKQGR